jgi:hypothetical protein
MLVDIEISIYRRYDITNCVQHLPRHHRRPHPTIDQWNGKLVERQPHAPQHHQDAAYDHLQKETAVRPTTNSNTQRHRPQAYRKIRVPRRSPQQQHELRRTMGCHLIKNQPSNLLTQETQTHGFHGRQARVHLQKLDPEPVHLRRTLASISINKSKKGNASTTTSLLKRHRNIHRQSPASAQHQAHGGLSERTMRQHRPTYP